MHCAFAKLYLSGILMFALGRHSWQSESHTKPFIGESRAVMSSGWPPDSKFNHSCWSIWQSFLLQVMCLDLLAPVLTLHEKNHCLFLLRSSHRLVIPFMVDSSNDENPDAIDG